MDKTFQDDNEKQKVEENIDPFIDLEVKDFSSTNGCVHFFIESPLQDKNTELISVECINCPHGAMIEPDKFKLENGKVIKK